MIQSLRVLAEPSHVTNMLSLYRNYERMWLVSGNRSSSARKDCSHSLRYRLAYNRAQHVGGIEQNKRGGWERHWTAINQWVWISTLILRLQGHCYHRKQAETYGTSLCQCRQPVRSTLRAGGPHVIYALLPLQLLPLSALQGFGWKAFWWSWFPQPGPVDFQNSACSSFWWLSLSSFCDRKSDPHPTLWWANAAVHGVDQLVVL